MPWNGDGMTADLDADGNIPFEQVRVRASVRANTNPLPNPTATLSLTLTLALTLTLTLTLTSSMPHASTPKRRRSKPPTASATRSCS